MATKVASVTAANRHPHVQGHIRNGGRWQLFARRQVQGETARSKVSLSLRRKKGKRAVIESVASPL